MDAAFSNAMHSDKRVKMLRKSHFTFSSTNGISHAFDFNRKMRSAVSE